MKDKEYDFLLDRLFARAVEAFKATEEYGLLHERLDQMNRDCKTMFTKEEQAFAAECFALILHVENQKQRHSYRQGLQDGTWLLRGLGLFA